MLRNYLKIALRNATKQKGYALINVLGLGIGMACCLLVALFVEHELGYDAYHQRADRIWRVVAGDKARMPIPLAPLLRAQLPGVEGALRIHRGWGPAMSRGDKSFYKQVRFADAQVFDFFDVEFLRGDPATALAEPYSLVISPHTAELFFGDGDPMGQVLTWDGAFDYTVTGVARTPKNTHFRFGMLASYETVLQPGPQFGNREDLEHWGYLPGRSKYTYLLLPADYDAAGFGARVLDLIEAHAGAEARETFAEEFGVPRLQRLTDIHLHSQLADEMGLVGDSERVYLLAAIGLFVLAIACVNFMNLATARSQRRAREVGVRKVLGAERRQLVAQFLGESLLFALAGLLLALGLAEAALPHFVEYVDRPLALDLGGGLVPTLACLAVATGIGAGLYPAFFLSAFQPAQTLKARVRAGVLLRRALVVFQFAISIGLGVAAGVVYGQIGYLYNKKLGYDKDQVAMLEVDYPGVNERLGALQHDLAAHPDIVASAGLRHPPGRRMNEVGVLRALGGGTPLEMPVLNVEAGYFELFAMEMAAGRPFARDVDVRQSIVLNEASLPSLGFASPQEALGATFEYQIKTGSYSDGTGEYAAGTVVGVVRDFHAESLYRPIAPLFLVYRPGPWGFYRVAVKFRAGSTGAAVEHMRATWQHHIPHLPFGPWFLDQRFAYLYREEERLLGVLGVFTALAVFVACLGIFALAAFAAERRTKEIGLRKALGATVGHIVRLLSKEFAWLVLVANAVAWPAAWWALDGWLENFAYRMDLGPAAFVAGGAAALVVAMLTVSGQAVRAALKNPVEALRYE